MAAAGWPGDVKDRKSTSGYVCFMGETPIRKEMVYLINLVSNITEINIPVQMFCDNTAAQTIAGGKSGPVTKGAKHIDIRYHLIRELVASG